MVRVATGRVVDGKVVIDGEPLDEGATVTVIAVEADQTLALSAEQEAALRRSLDEANRGDGIDGDAFLDELSR